MHLCLVVTPRHNLKANISSNEQWWHFWVPRPVVWHVSRCVNVTLCELLLQNRCILLHLCSVQIKTLFIWDALLSTSELVADKGLRSLFFFYSAFSWLFKEKLWDFWTFWNCKIHQVESIWKKCQDVFTLFCSLEVCAYTHHCQHLSFEFIFQDIFVMVIKLL